VLGEVADGAQAELPEALGDPGPDAGEGLDRRFGIRAAARGLRRTGVGAGEPGRRGGYGSPSQ
jgi:hypothetical protein